MTHTPAPSPHLLWTVKNGTRVLTENLSDKQLQQALNFGMSLAAKHFRAKGQACLAAQRNGAGPSYLADIKNAVYLQMACNRRDLLKRMYLAPATPRSSAKPMPASSDTTPCVEPQRGRSQAPEQALFLQRIQTRLTPCSDLHGTVAKSVLSGAPLSYTHRYTGKDNPL